jgi:hypothetical protein
MGQNKPSGDVFYIKEGVLNAKPLATVNSGLTTQNINDTRLEMPDTPNNVFLTFLNIINKFR